MTSPPSIIQVHPALRKLILFGAPLLTFALLVFHPIGDLSQLMEAEQFTEIDVYAFIVPVANRFIIVHVLFAPMIALMGLAVLLLVNHQRGIAATLSRAATGVFIVMYIMYETIIGTASGVLIRSAASLPTEEQVVVSAMVNNLWSDPIFGDGALISTIAMLAWALAVTAAAVSLYRSGKPLGACLLLGFSFMFAFHSPPLGTMGLALFLLAVWRLEQAAIREVSKAHKQHSSFA